MSWLNREVLVHLNYAMRVLAVLSIRGIHWIVFGRRGSARRAILRLIKRGFGALFLLPLLYCQSCRVGSSRTIAIIPRMTGTLLWEPAHIGAESVAKEFGFSIYWNAALREGDVDGQVSLVRQKIQRGCAALVIAPSNAAALVSQVQNALARKIPTVVISSALPIPPGRGLHYILNDEVEGGRLAAQRVGIVLHGRGSVALIGIDPSIMGMLTRARSFEQSLANSLPEVQIVDRRAGSFSRQREQQTVDDVLRKNPGLGVIVALNWTSAYEAISSIESQPDGSNTAVIAFDPDGLPFGAPSLDSVVMENTRQMGERAVRIIASGRSNEASSTETVYPVLITRENVGSPQIRQMLAMPPGLGPSEAKGSFVQ